MRLKYSYDEFADILYARSKDVCGVYMDDEVNPGVLWRYDMETEKELIGFMVMDYHHYWGKRFLTLKHEIKRMFPDLENMDELP